MQQQRRRGLRDFVQSPIGRVLLIAFALAVVFGAFYVSVLLAIPAILIVGLWLPIYSGLKRPRYLALSGLVVLLLIAPIVTVSYTNELLVPLGTASSGPSGVDWSVTVGNTTVHALSSDITFHLPTGTTNYRVSAVPGYTTTLAGSVVVGTSSTSVPVTFSAVRYAVTFTESDLPVDTQWGVTVGTVSATSATSSVTLHLANGTYPYVLAAVPHFTAPSDTGTVDVAGAAVGVSVVFAKAAYAVSFAESGLPAGTPWTVASESTNVTSSAGTIVLDLPNGTLPYRAASSSEYSTPSGQSVVVAGAPIAVPVAFTAVRYPVTFTETNLPVGKGWTLTVGGTAKESTSSTNVFDLTNGTFPYELSPVDGYTPVAANGTVTVAGAPVGAALNFSASASAFRATFSETGLAAGTEWAVTLEGATVRSTTGSLEFNVSNGTYPYAVSRIPGFPGPTGGTVAVAGHPATTGLTFKSQTYLVEFVEGHLGAGAKWNVTVNALTHPSRSTRVEFNLTNGTYPYLIGAPSGETPPASNATVVVDGAGRNLSVPFAATTYPVVFAESGLPSGGGTAIIQNASVTPFHGSSSTTFTWTATIYPQYLPSTGTGPLWIDLYISTCPGATTPNGTSACSAGYPFLALTDYFCSNPATAATCEASAPHLTRPTTVSFTYTIGSDGIWEWQMGLAVENLAVHQPTYTLLSGDPMYDGLEGPVIGSFGTIFEVVLPSVYFESFLYLGGPFYAVLLMYAFLKNRERRREDARQRSAGPIPPTSGAETEAASAATGTAAVTETVSAGKPSPGPVQGEQACPNCGAVVYAGETKCWKCGVTLGVPQPPPLPSG